LQAQAVIRLAGAGRGGQRVGPGAAAMRLVVRQPVNSGCLSWA
jgi:hypothetical protein